MRETTHTPEPWRPSPHSGDAIVAGDPPAPCADCDAASATRWPGTLCPAHAWTPDLLIGDREREFTRRHYGGRLVAESMHKADRRRIVACVNACVGIPTEHLEAAGEGGIKGFLDLVSRIVQALGATLSAPGSVDLARLDALLTELTAWDARLGPTGEASR